MAAFPKVNTDSAENNSPVPNPPPPMVGAGVETENSRDISHAMFEAGWREATSSNGRLYYFNVYTRHSVWNLQDVATQQREQKMLPNKPKSDVLSVAAEWLDWEAESTGVYIQHQFNHKEKSVGSRNVRVDGYCKETNTAYQLQGCFWHGHKCPLNLNDINPINKKTREVLMGETQKTSSYIRGLGYNLVELWECEWKAIQKTDSDLRNFLKSVRLPHCNTWKMSTERSLKGVRDGSIFGLVECDLRVPPENKDYFAEMPPVFKNVDISMADIGGHMRQYAKEMNIMNKPRRSLIGSMFGTKLLLATPLLSWCLEHGLEVTRVYEVIQYKPNACFEEFGNRVTQARRDGDSDPNKAIIADTMKLLGNSAYGKTVTDQLKHVNVQVCSDANAPAKINDRRFKALHLVGDGMYEVDMFKKGISLNLPIQIGFFVYQYAKLRMLQFYFDFLMKFVDRRDFQMCEMDTDSAYMAISGDSLDDVIKPSMKDQYHREKHLWFPRQNTPEQYSYDKRTPGLFKVEWEGEGIIALCSKTYFCFGATEKFSCKGLNRRNNELTKEKYMAVLNTRSSGGGVNKGFIMKHGVMFTYEQRKTALTYFYPKRKVQEDGVSTTYLDI